MGYVWFFGLIVNYIKRNGKIYNYLLKNLPENLQQYDKIERRIQRTLNFKGYSCSSTYVYKEYIKSIIPNYKNEEKIIVKKEISQKLHEIVYGKK